MLNTVALIGKLASAPTSAPLKDNFTHEIEVEVDGEKYPIWIWKGMADIIADKYPIGTTLGIKASLKKYYGHLYIVASSISFITEAEHD